MKKPEIEVPEGGYLLGCYRCGVPYVCVRGAGGGVRNGESFYEPARWAPRCECWQAAYEVPPFTAHFSFSGWGYQARRVTDRRAPTERRGKRSDADRLGPVRDAIGAFLARHLDMAAGCGGFAHKEYDALFDAVVAYGNQVASSPHVGWDRRTNHRRTTSERRKHWPKP